MFDRQSLHIALLVWGFIFSLIAAVCMFMSKNFDKEKRKIMLHMLFACAVLLLSDAFSWGYRGSLGEQGYYMVRISNFLVFFFSDLLLMLYHRYVCCILFGENENVPANVSMGTKRKIKTVYVIAVIAMILVIVNQFTGFYYYFDAQNFYHRNYWYFLSMLLPVIGMIIDFVLILQYQSNVSRRVKISLLSYIVLPYVAAEMVHNFAKYLRGNFSEMNNSAPILLSQEMEHCRYYVSIEKVRFPDMEITFDLERWNEDKKHIGLRNIRERLKAMCDGTLTIESVPGKGTKVLVQIPKKEKEGQLL